MLKKSVQWEQRRSVRTEGRTDMTKLIVAYGNFVNAPKNAGIFVFFKSWKVGEGRVSQSPQAYPNFFHRNVSQHGSAQHAVIISTIPLVGWWLTVYILDMLPFRRIPQLYRNENTYSKQYSRRWAYLNGYWSCFFLHHTTWHYQYHWWLLVLYLHDSSTL